MSAAKAYSREARKWARSLRELADRMEDAAQAGRVVYLEGTCAMDREPEAGASDEVGVRLWESGRETTIQMHVLFTETHR